MSRTVSSTAGPCDLVVFAAHPDDAELNCGGTLLLGADQGWKTAVVDFTRGELSTRGTPERRANETDEASHVLGLSYRVNLGLADGHLHDSDENRQAVVRLLRSMRPRVVIAPPLEDHHADHVAVARILESSLYLSGVEKYCPDADPWRPHTLLHYVGSRSVAPQIVVDISSVHERRTRAVLSYRSQFHDPQSEERPTRISHPEFLDWVNGALKHYGLLIGASYGEGYTSPEPVPVFNLVEQLGRVRWEQSKVGD
ncbi:MAG: bacillithiol biosynthesis deacetylase BshB1 [Planctomycetota bacterium]|nr:bacillithiol biosynthesis deacetylase BshB1 [Planctomycetota bacterium]